MSLFGFHFLSAETPALLEKNEEPVMVASVDKEVPDESKDEKEEDRSPEVDQENRAPALAPASDHYSALTEEEENIVEAKLQQEFEEIPGLMEDMNPVSPSRVPLECDYDVNPTKLYEALQQRNWEASIERCKTHDKEARTWVARKEKNGKLRWRLLPLHAAVIFKAPDNVLEALLAAYPRGVECKDDQGMLPLHLAFRNGSSEGCVNLLLAAFPKSIEVKDRKGRIPLALAQASTSPNRDAFMRALERGPAYYAQAAAATERAAVTAEQQAIFDAKVREMEEAHQQQMQMLRVDAEQKQMDVEEKIKQLEQDLEKTQETSQVLVEHVNTLEAQLKSRTDTERFLATRIAALDIDLKETARGKEDLEATLKNENEELKNEKRMLEGELKALQEERGSHGEKLGAAEAKIAKLQSDFEIERKELQDNLFQLQKEWASAKASEAILEAQLKKRIKSERGLAGEVSFLASRLAESAQDSSNSVGNYSNRVRELEQERDELRFTVKALTQKLSNVARALDDMMIGQQKIVEAASAHEQNMLEVAEIHSKLVMHARRHQDLFETAQKEREDLVMAIKRQEEEAAKQLEERKAILEAFELQEEQMGDANRERKQLVASVEQQCLGIQSLIVNNLRLIAPALNTQEDEVVDEMVKIVLSTDTHENATFPAAAQDEMTEKIAASLEETLKRIEAQQKEEHARIEAEKDRLEAEKDRLPPEDDDPMEDDASEMEETDTPTESAEQVRDSEEVESFDDAP